MGEDIGKVLSRQVAEAQGRHPNVGLFTYPSGEWRVAGRIGFSVEHDGKRIEDTYSLVFLFPPDYPASPPVVFERDGKIPESFGHFMAAGNFCLGAPVEVRRRFAEHRNLLRFIEDQVIPYLFTYSYKKRYGKLPFGELDHGSGGLLQYYMEYFETSGIEAMKLLKCLADGFAPPLMACPCGADSKLAECHGPRLVALEPHQSPRQFERELWGMIRLARAARVRLPEKKVMPKRLWRLQERQRRRKAKQRKRGKQKR